MSTPLVIGVTLAYVGTALDYLVFKRDPGSALMFASYALANIGWLWHLGMIK